MSITAASEVLQRYRDNLKQSRILFAGNIQDDLPARFVCAESRAHTQFYHRWQMLRLHMGERARFSLVTEQIDVTESDTLVYYWPKNKPEANFQLMNLLSLLPIDCDILVVGENLSGVRSAEKILKVWAPLNKIDSARHCSLYHGRLEKKPVFVKNKFWGEYLFDGLIIKTLPGIFSRRCLDEGSQLLISTLGPHFEGKVLNVGCGAGVLAIVLAKHSPKAHLSLCDVSASAVEASRATFAINRFKCEIFYSNVFSDITNSYDLIISNPPFHDSIKPSLGVAKTLIRGAAHHLNSNGELRIVANAFLPYPNILDETFGSHEVIAQTNRFKVYRTIMKRHTKKRLL